MAAISKAALLRSFGLQNERDLLFHFPKRYEDRMRWGDPLHSAEGEMVTFRGKIVQTKFARWRFGKSSFEIILQPEASFAGVTLAWYNLPYLKNSLTEGKQLIVYGKVSLGKTTRKFIHPEFEVFHSDEDEQIHVNRLTPVYPLTEGVGQKALRRAIYLFLEKGEFTLPEIHPQVPHGLMGREEAVRQIHFPLDSSRLESARKRLVYDEIFLMQLVLAQRRNAMSKVTKSRAQIHHALVEDFRRSLPFHLTPTQERVCRELDADLNLPHPMNRLLQGDVGSGKTIVALHAILRTLERGENAAFLAPTETLAEQQARNFTRFLEPLGIGVQLWTRSHKPEFAPLLERRGHVYVGTHALIQEKVVLENLGLGVIDEQHKFGVLQRAALRAKGTAPDLLFMTATPIPRTLCLTQYGDLDLSILEGLPQGRTPIKTVLRKREQLPKVWEFIKKELSQKRQAYVVFPLVEESEKSDLKAVQKELAALQKIFGVDQVRMLHGKMKSAEKREVMRGFRANEFGILAATSVIEVGIDVANATVMVIENAERFGLAQLHQLRGRVGRGSELSYCVLISSESGKDSWRRLKMMEESTDGFRLAEEDFAIRGPGNILGTEQSGLPPLILADLIRDRDILTQARSDAKIRIERDPELRNEPALREALATQRCEHLTATTN